MFGSFFGGASAAAAHVSEEDLMETLTNFHRLFSDESDAGYITEFFQNSIPRLAIPEMFANLLQSYSFIRSADDLQPFDSSKVDLHLTALKTYVSLALYASHKQHPNTAEKCAVLLRDIQAKQRLRADDASASSTPDHGVDQDYVVGAMKSLIGCFLPGTISHGKNVVMAVMVNLGMLSRHPQGDITSGGEESRSVSEVIEDFKLTFNLAAESAVPRRSSGR